MASVTEVELVERLDRARQRQREVDWSDRAAAADAAEQTLAAWRAPTALRSEQYADATNVGLQWNLGAPLPHLLCNGARAVVGCCAGEPDPVWDGTV